MGISHPLLLEIIFHVGNAIALIAYLFRDQIHLRVVVIVSMILQSSYYVLISAGGPLWDPLSWKILTIVVNVVMIALLFRDRLRFGIDDEVKPLFEAFGVLSPGQFRRLLACAERRGGAMPLTERGVRPTSLFHVLSGAAEVNKDGRRLGVGAGSFIGEIAFLTGGPATADVRLQAGARVLQWDVGRLRALMRKEKAIDIALRGLLSHDLAVKTSHSALPEQAGLPNQGALSIS
ncbi:MULTISPECIES: cyclic nucleotide-binding domain-containing protein [Kaistia]|uniref:Cyclic nucleotide-binding domain-containing protein n=1 Tax=Kaistia nematophila TaxID=2994654 RepID=A0A9X3E2P8_9HYPH|nr:cyclic nucleotide-binding domain-containing protein [Kaistia nematophila]MBN9026471.1 cyclic nucleotide-binding domain-containing protein [Hyphomicrobiales bacterium]MBN9060156.1 cyclic nucleotide-binding domain-containing protein [Hyphomicrobiales bacterium]MCX5570540.1 cyclic nucleotide-binding domain-containing protein [Kaistia nematophila]